MLVSKIDAARRQLITAIRLFFDGGDPVSVYSLASNTWEVTDVLCTSVGVESFSKRARENLPVGHTLKYYINEPCRNFFKQAPSKTRTLIALSNCARPTLSPSCFWPWRTTYDFGRAVL
ncbi:hypothetical protein ACS15_4790 [Ralstonia insidiosa]|uniref:Uncharacterized protein n=1 Tax=Ralstonia insidiosa TaxID=190721 RepID=A0AAC9BM73_9RALS|nr:hypothetical protein ACS15_4790 [Ralstonia insidiosa]